MNRDWRQDPGAAEEKGLAMPDDDADDGPEIEIISIGDEDDDVAAGSAGSADSASSDTADGGAPGAADPAALRGTDGTAAELAEASERYLRLRADFENFRKRVERERGELSRRALVEPMGELLPVLDNLERALGAEGEAADLRAGVELILKQLVETLRRFGLSEIAADGQPFDPRLHEAVAREEDPAVSVPIVVAELQRGYWLNERLLRPAMVRVAVPPEEPADIPVEGRSRERSGDPAEPEDIP